MSDETTPQTMAEADAALVGGLPEAPAPEPVAEPTVTPDADAGQPRDEKGRFTASPKAEPEAPAPVAEEPAAAPEQPVEPAASEPEPPAEDYPAFSYRADGQDFHFPGSAVGEDEVGS